MTTEAGSADGRTSPGGLHGAYTWWTSMFPWDPESGIRWLATTVGSGALLVYIWYQASGEAVFPDQISAASWMVGALLVGVFGNVSMVLKARRRIGARREAMLGNELALVPIAVRRHRHAVEVGSEWLAVDGLAFYHRPGCPMIEGRHTMAASEEEHRAEHRQACGLCGRDSSQEDADV